MSTIDASALVLSSGISLFALWLILRVLYRDTLVDAYKSQLFRLRDELFDLGHQDEIGFDAPAYINLRRSINGFIREIPSFGITWVVGYQSYSRDELDALGYTALKKQWEESIDSLNPDTRAAIRNIERRLHLHVGAYLILRSPIIALLILVPALITLFAVLVAFTMGAEVKAGITQRFRDLTAAAYAVGHT